MVVDLLFDAVKFESKFASVMESAEKQPQSQLSRLQRSVVGASSRRSDDESTKSLASFLAEGINMLRSTLERVDDTLHVTIPDDLGQSIYTVDSTSLRACFHFLSELFDVTHSNDFDEAAFLIYAESGQDVINGLKSQPATIRLARALERGLDRFAPFWQLQSGQSMEMIWSQLKPNTPTTANQFDLIMQVERLADRFDDLLWTSDVPLARIFEIRNLLAQVGRAAEADEVDEESSLQVRSAHIFSPHRLTFGQNVAHALDNLEAGSDILVDRNYPYLQPEFETLRQYQSTLTEANTVETETAISLVSGEPTKELWQQRFNVSKLTGIARKDTALSTVRRTFPLSVIYKLYVMGLC